MRKTLLAIAALLQMGLGVLAQLETDKPIVLVGGAGERYITGLESPVNNTDAANKEYVDNSVSATGGGFYLPTLGDGSLPTMMTDESATTMNLLAAIDYCRNLVEGGFSNWRVPTPDEVIYLRAGDATYSGIPNPSSSNNFWTYAPTSDGTGGSGASARGVTLNFGSSVATFWTWSNSYRARCVR